MVISRGRLKIPAPAKARAKATAYWRLEWTSVFAVLGRDGLFRFEAKPNGFVAVP
jgi:hypothetical protein